MASALATGLTHSGYQTHLEVVPGEAASALAPLRDSERASEDEGSALDGALLSARALNAIVLIWGRDARRRDLLERDAYERLTRTRGVGAHTIAEIEVAVAGWGLGGIGGKRGLDRAGRKRLSHEKRLAAVLRAAGPKEMLALLADLCEQQSASSQQKVSTRSSRLRRARCERAIVYYARCSEYFRECAAGVPQLPDI